MHRAGRRKPGGTGGPARLALGVLTGLGGLVDVGNLVANPQAGARYGMSLAVYIVVAAGGVTVYSEMAGRITAVTGRAGMQFMDTGLHRRVVGLNVAVTVLLTVAMAAAEVGGAATVLADTVGGPYRLWVVVVAGGLGAALARFRFGELEQVFGLLGLLIVVTVATLIAAEPHWAALGRSVAAPWPPPTGSTADYLETVVAQVGSMIIPYQLIFFSSGAAEEEWGPQDVGVGRWNVVLGYGLGTLVVLALMADAATLYRPAGQRVSTLAQVTAMPGLAGLGLAGTAVLAVGMLATTVGAAMETTAAIGYTLGQRRGWRWGVQHVPGTAPRFYRVVLGALGVATVVMLAGVDPVRLTNATLVLSAVALPLTYLPTWLRARDRRVMGRHANGRALDAVAAAYFGLICLVALAAVPLWVLGHPW